MSIDRMDRLRELRGLRRSVAEKDVERARANRADFEARVSAAQEAHQRAAHDATTRRRAAIDSLMAEPSGPLGVARMANVHAVVDGEIAEAAAEETRAKEGLAEADTELEEARDVLAAFIRRETAMDAAIDRLEGEAARAADDAEEDEA